MCLIALAQGMSETYPLIIAANRDEFYERPTRDAHVWSDAPRVVGGRDALHGGAWLAVTREGRFAAVTNLRGAMTRGRSRGFLVRDFVAGDAEPLAYARSIDVARYAGFHLLVGQVGGDVAYVASTPRLLEPGIYGISNAPEGEHWPKEATAIEAMRHALTLDDPTEELLAFLAAPRGTNDPEQEVFIASERYGTRSSTVILVSRDAVVFREFIPTAARDLRWRSDAGSPWRADGDGTEDPSPRSG
ncbi:MAG TPA: NRDE family protein [Thermoanaerobaculia bacterium]|jgi:uncharacterized protein with NRDE domain